MKTRKLKSDSSALRILLTGRLAALVVGLCFGLASIAGAQTQVSGTIINQTWTSNNSPYIVIGNINVAGLTINPGVTVSFATNYAFEVDGVLRAQGTPNAPIVFMGTNGGWQGIYFNNSSPRSILNCCVISNSVNSGIRILSSSLSINDCSIEYDSSQIYGGGIYIDNTSGSGNLKIINTIIANNNAKINPALVPYNDSEGGGIYALMNTNNLQIIGCTISNNTANANYGYGWAEGGGLFVSGNATLNWCVISGNNCTGKTEYNVTGGTARGGGIFASGGQITLNNCLLENNTASSPNTGAGDEWAYGGAFYISSGSVGMENCTVQGNTVSAPQGADGAGICVAGGNYGNGYFPGVGNLNLINCTIAYNNIEGLAVNSGSTASVLNSIVYFNASGGTQITGVSGTMGAANVTNCDVQGGFSGLGNINSNPVFLSTADLIIVPGSPCINAGNANAIYNNVCFPPSLGKKHNDMGADGGPGAGAMFQIESWPQIEVLLFGGVPGYTYQIQASTNLVNWQTVEQFQIANVGDVTNFFEPTTNTLPQRFYQLDLAP